MGEALITRRGGENHSVWTSEDLPNATMGVNSNNLFWVKANDLLNIPDGLYVLEYQVMSYWGYTDTQVQDGFVSRGVVYFEKSGKTFTTQGGGCSSKRIGANAAWHGVQTDYGRIDYMSNPDNLTFYLPHAITDPGGTLRFNYGVQEFTVTRLGDIDLNWRDQSDYIS